MPRLEDLPEPVRRHVEALPCDAPEGAPFVTPLPPDARRVALVTTAGLSRRDDATFIGGAGDYRVIPGDVAASDLLMSHISVNFDRLGFQQDANVVFPIDRLAEAASERVIGSVARYHYSFMGATDPAAMEVPARELAGLLRADDVDTVLLTAV